MSMSSGSVLRALSKHFQNTSTALKSSPGPRDSEWEQKPFIFVYGHNTATECRHFTAAALTLTVIVGTSSSSVSSSPPLSSSPSPSPPLRGGHGQPVVASPSETWCCRFSVTSLCQHHLWRAHPIALSFLWAHGAHTNWRRRQWCWGSTWGNSFNGDVDDGLCRRAINVST